MSGRTEFRLLEMQIPLVPLNCWFRLSQIRMRQVRRAFVATDLPGSYAADHGGRTGQQQLLPDEETVTHRSPGP
jgi:hypothetical protein